MPFLESSVPAEKDARLDEETPAQNALASRARELVCLFAFGPKKFKENVTLWRRPIQCGRRSALPHKTMPVLSGACDIVACVGADGSIQTGPWHVRFGRRKVWSPEGKKVSIWIGKVRVEALEMRLDAEGDAYFPESVPPPSPSTRAPDPPQNTSAGASKASPKKADFKAADSKTLSEQPITKASPEDNDKPPEEKASFFKTSNQKLTGSQASGGRRRRSRASIRHPDDPAKFIPPPGALEKVGTALRMAIDGVVPVEFRAENGQTLSASLFVWPFDSRIVICDIDGTITKSDIGGHVAAFFGKHYAHEDIARLLTRIRSSNYRILYLTARSIGYSNPTRSYLNGFRQRGEETLPKGPLLLSPDGFVQAITHSLLKVPHLYKQWSLRHVAALFRRGHERKMKVRALGPQPPGGPAVITMQPQTVSGESGGEGKNKADRFKPPFYFGFGNRETDAKAYAKVGVPSDRISIINTQSVARVGSGAGCPAGMVLQKGYSEMLESVDKWFPPREKTRIKGRYY